MLKMPRRILQLHFQVLSFSNLITMTRLKCFRVQFKPIKRKDRGTYTCYVQWSDNGLSNRKLPYYISIRIQHKTPKSSKSKHGVWKSMSQEKRPLKAEEPTSKMRRQSDQLHESQPELKHVVGIVGKSEPLICSVQGKFLFSATQIC